MSIGVTVNMSDVRDGASERMQIFMDGLRSKAGLHEAVGRRALSLTRNHLLQIAETRHETAQSLGASPSGHWAQATEKTTMKSSEEMALISVKHPGIGRAAHDVDIVPKGGMYLTIALIAAAYNRRARRVPGLFFVRPKGADYALLGKREGKGESAQVTWWYLLVQSVHQQQDRSLMPSEEEYRQAVLEGINDYVGYLIERGGQRDSKRGFKEFSS